MEKKYDLKERTYKFAVEIVRFCLMLSKRIEVKSLSNQLLRSGTSIGANVEEGDGARTRKEFGNKMTIARNEAKEAKYWLNLLIDSEIVNNPQNITKAKAMISECDELVRILSAIIGKLD
jgi:four helix bundle protein